MNNLKQGLGNGISWFGETILGFLQYNVTSMFVAAGCLGPILIGFSVFLLLITYRWLGSDPPITPTPTMPQAVVRPAVDEDGEGNPTDRLTNAQWADLTGANAFAIEGDGDRQECKARKWVIMAVNLPDGQTVQECQFIVYK